MKSQNIESVNPDIHMIGCRGMKKHDVDPELLLRYAKYMFPEAFKKEDREDGLAGPNDSREGA